MSCKAIDSKTAVFVYLAMIKVIAIKLAKFLIAKSLKLGHCYLISIICTVLLQCRTMVLKLCACAAERIPGLPRSFLGNMLIFQLCFTPCVGLL